MKTDQILSVLAISGLLAGVVALNRWYRKFRKTKPPVPAVDDLNIW